MTSTGARGIFRLVGTAVMTIGLAMLSRTAADTSLALLLVMMLLLGLGMGLVMQVLVIAVQNAVDYRELGVATSGNSLFRSIGGSVGTAVLGAIFASRLAAELATHPGAGGGAGISLGAMAQLPPAVRATYAQAFTSAIDTVFLVATTIAALGFVATWLLPERPLRDTAAIDEEARRAPYDAATMQNAVAELRSAGHVAVHAGAGARQWEITPSGCTALARIVDARRAHIESVFGQWTAEEREELATLIRRVSHELVPDARVTGEHYVVTP